MIQDGVMRMIGVVAKEQMHFSISAQQLKRIIVDAL